MHSFPVRRCFQCRLIAQLLTRGHTPHKSEADGVCFASRWEFAALARGAVGSAAPQGNSGVGSSPLHGGRRVLTPPERGDGVDARPGRPRLVWLSWSPRRGWSCPGHSPLRLLLPGGRDPRPSAVPQHTNSDTVQSAPAPEVSGVTVCPRRGSPRGPGRRGLGGGSPWRETSVCELSCEPRPPLSSASFCARPSSAPHGMAHLRRDRSCGCARRAAPGIRTHPLPRCCASGRLLRAAQGRAAGSKGRLCLHC